jgi:AcrR family transcriptional regulator
MNRRDLVLDAMLELMKEKSNMSVSNIAKRAGIAKGGIYYYFSSKEEILSALIDRSYDLIIENCKMTLKQSEEDALTKFRLLYTSFFCQQVNSEIDSYLHLPQNAGLHKKALSKILTDISPVLAEILKARVDERCFDCEFPEEYAEIILSVFTFLLDPGIFNWSLEKISKKIKVLAGLLERGLIIPPGSMSFLYELNVTCSDSMLIIP